MPKSKSGKMFRVGDRVELPGHYAAYRAGRRYGTITSFAPASPGLAACMRIKLDIARGRERMQRIWHSDWDFVRLLSEPLRTDTPAVRPFSEPVEHDDTPEGNDENEDT